ncbi:5'-3' exoribonuclease 2 [Phytophthora pseudosyringae]|uniref:5'-3' exoribonuclease n=1 Tax=Phytophthora pseudosyringae TaxID=221518 RepID=A0A8T1V8B8_9STRA|nr:5'-3' exoribonuclease 2 [Phytophthora pseudosyringae]
MGVPAFYRWVQEKYPKCVVDCVESRAVVLEGERHFELTDTTGPNPNGFEVDNLYVDMNGLIHPCAHPENGEAPKTEEEMYRRVMAYVDRLVAAVRPRRVLYLAIDGVAPRAKMNQQRARRFRAAQEAEQRVEVEKEALEYMSALGHKVPSKQEKPWDSNVITPGTKFMAKLAKHLRFYVRDRVNNNATWKSIKVVLSDAGVPGEGEHKLMQYIRVQRSQPGYDPNQHHVLHGLDADLIMLGLATHEVKFSILREEVLFGKQKYERERQKEQQMVLDANGTTLNKRKRGEFGEHDADLIASDLKPLQYLHIATLREYLQVEFEPLSRVLPFEYDFERVVDDFVFLCFFVGNDFLPHLPSLDIRDGALDFLILIYAKLLPAMGGYITNGGQVDLSRVDVILAEVGQVEDVIFQRRAIKQAENERRRKSRLSNEKRDQIGAAAAKDSAVEILKKRRIDKDIIAADKKYGGLSPEEAVKARVKESVDKKLEQYREEIQDVVRLGEPGWKTRYYSDKLKADDIEVGGGRERVFHAYIEGLCWVMRYYYTGCASWQWFYPFHYAPFASDLRNIDRFEIKFEEGLPFHPFEQLMGVFPAGSGHAIPKSYRWLMSDPESPIIDFYPKDIPVDPNGKAMPWLWVVLLPFIDEGRLLDAMKEPNQKLTEAEMKRNARFGKEVVFFHSKCPVTKNPPTTELAEAQADPRISQSFNGTLIYIESLFFPIGGIVPSPEKSQRHLVDIPNNQCYSFQYRLPPTLPHLSKILDGAQPPSTVLISDNDKRITIPFFGKANINIVDLAGDASNHTNVRQNYMSRHNGGGGRGGFGGRGGGGRGGGGRGYGGQQGYHQQGNQRFANNNLNVDRYGGAPQQQQYNQYMANGHGNWGSQEPRNKRGQYGDSYNQHNGGQSSYGRPSSDYRGGGYNGGGYNGNGGRGYQGSFGGRGHQGGFGGRGGGRGAPIQSAFGGSLQSAQAYPSNHIGSAAPAAPAPRGLEALKAGLRSMHQQRQNNANGPPGGDSTRYDR